MRNRLSPSLHSLLDRSKVRGADATRKFGGELVDGFLGQPATHQREITALVESNEDRRAGGGHGCLRFASRQVAHDEAWM
jgi:hypothetical protein